LLFFVAPVISRYYGISELTLILRVLALRIPLSAYNSIQTAFVSSHMVFKKSFVANSGGVLFSGILGIYLAVDGFGIWALVAQSLLCVLFNTFIMIAVVKWWPKCQFSIVRLMPLVKYGWKLLATGLMFTIYAELRSLIIGKRYSAADLGFYDRGYSFPRLIASNIDSTINRVLFPTLSHVQDSPSQLLGMARRSGKTSAYLMTPLLFGLAAIAEPLTLLLLGNKWLPAVPYIQIMCFVWWLQPTQTCAAQVIKAIGKSGTYLKIEVISKICGLLLLAWAVLIVNTVYAIAMSMLIGQTIAFVIYGICVSKCIGYKFTDQIHDILVPALLGTLMCFSIYYIPCIIENAIPCLFSQVLIGGVVYVGLSALFKLEEFHYLLSFMKRKK